MGGIEVAQRRFHSLGKLRKKFPRVPVIVQLQIKHHICCNLQQQKSFCSLYDILENC